MYLCKKDMSRLSEKMWTRIFLYKLFNGISSYVHSSQQLSFWGDNNTFSEDRLKSFGSKIFYLEMFAYHWHITKHVCLNITVAISQVVNHVTCYFLYKPPCCPSSTWMTLISDIICIRQTRRVTLTLTYLFVPIIGYRQIWGQTPVVLHWMMCTCMHV